MFDPKKYFRATRKELIERPLAQFGFKNWGPEHLLRITGDNVAQFIRFRKARYGGTRFTVNLISRPLCCPIPDALPAAPGCGLVALSGMRRKKNEVWYFATKEEADESLAAVYQLLLKSALPFFNQTATAVDIIRAYERNFLGFRKFGRKFIWGFGGWEHYDFGHIYLSAGKISKAKTHFDKFYKIFSADGREWALERAAEFPFLMKLLYGPQTHIDQYLADVKAKNMEYLKLDK